MSGISAAFLASLVEVVDPDQLKWRMIPAMGKVDNQITLAINGLTTQSAFLDQFMTVAAIYLGPILVIATALLWFAYPKQSVERYSLVVCGLTFILGLSLNQIIILFVQRIRPYDAGLTNLIISRSADPSFPSDHATAAFAIVFGFLICKQFGKSALFLFLALIVALSRIYVGTHYASDILGGMGTALVAAIVVRGLYRKALRLNRSLTSIL